MSVKLNSNKIASSPARITAVLAVAILCLGLTQCSSNQTVTAQYVAQGWHAKNVTVMPIQDPYLSKDEAVDLAERVAERIRQWIPDAKVYVDDSMIGMPESDILDYAQTGVRTGHYLYGKIWTPRHGRKTYEVELLTRETMGAREVWSVAADTGNDEQGSDGWNDDVSSAVDVILARLPEGMMHDDM